MRSTRGSWSRGALGRRARPPPPPARGGGGAPGRARRATIGTVTSKRVVARTAPSATAPSIAVFDRTNPEGSRQVFLLEGRAGPWYRALLSIRPNGTRGYVPAGSLGLSSTSFRIEVDRTSRTLTWWNGCSRL